MLVPPPFFTCALLHALYTDVSAKLRSTFQAPAPDPSYVSPELRSAVESDPRTISAARGGLQDVATANCVVPECTQLKAAYDRCFIDWYRSEYLQRAKDARVDGPGHGAAQAPEGHSTAQAQAPEPCADLFREYNQCLVNGIAQADILKLEDLKVDIPRTRM